jgi:hypothetical protein
MRRTTSKWSALAVAASVLVVGAEAARAGGYYYQPRSFYVTPPIYANLPVFTSPPIVVYEPVVTYPAPVAGYFTPIGTTVVTPAPAVAPAPAAVMPSPAAYPAGRVRERQISTPFRTRYDYKVDYPGGLDYRYRYRRVGGVVRFSERWDD